MGCARGWTVGALALVFAVSGTASCGAQTTGTDWNARLVGKPLYLRDFWIADKLEFDAAGKLLGTSAQGPLSLSGVAVEQVSVNGKGLTIRGHRVALVAGETGRLERRDITSSTRIAFSLRRGDKKNFHANAEMQITVRPDAGGGFEAALHKIFATGLAELASSTPLYWRCYARSYFLPDEVSADAEKTVQRCTEGEGVEGTAIAERADQGPQILQSAEVQLPEVGARLGTSGTEIVHLRVRADGTPVGIQIIRALGGGVDEAALQAVSRYRFRPASLDGAAVPVNLTIQVHVAATP